jgi:tetratricopeptide (TPR) repeat protein
VDALLRGLTAAELLRFAALRGEPAAATPRCADAQASLAAGAPSPSEYYFVTGNVETSRERFIVTYEIGKCSGDRMSSVFRANRDVVWANASPELIAFVRAAVARIVDDIPRTTVLVRPFWVADQHRAEVVQFARELDAVVASAIDESEMLRSRDAGADFEVRGTLLERSRSDLNVQLVVLRADGQRAGGTQFLVSSDQDNAQEQIARNLVALVNRIRTPVAADTSTTASARELLGRAKGALCVDSPDPACKPDWERAFPILQAVLGRDSTNLDAWILLARAEAASGNRGQAIATLGTALAHARRVGNSNLHRVLNELALVYRSAGNQEEALRHYEESLRLDPDQPEIYVAASQAYRAANNGAAALRVLVDARARLPAALSLFTAEIANSIPQLQPEVVAANARLLAEACRSSRDREGCARTLSDQAAKLFGRGGDMEPGRGVLREILTLDPNTTLLVETHARLAASYLGTIQVGRDRETGFLLPDYPDFAGDSVASHLTLAEQAGAMRLPATYRQWLQRLGTYYWRAMRDYEKAFETAREAESTLNSPETRYLGGQVSYFAAAQAARGDPAGRDSVRVAVVASRLARAAALLEPLVLQRYEPAYPFYLETNHLLRRDTATRRVLERVIATVPGDTLALTNLAVICTDYLADFPCALRVALAQRDLGLLRSVVDTLSAVESATLGGEAAWASAMVERVLDQNLEPCLAAVGRFYTVWIAAAANDTERADRELSRWRSAVQASRGAPTARACWVFAGAGRLARQSAHPRAQLLLQMIEAMSNASAPLPTF